MSNENVAIIDAEKTQVDKRDSEAKLNQSYKTSDSLDQLIAEHLDLNDKLNCVHYNEWKLKIKNKPTRPSDVIGIVKTEQALEGLAIREAARIEVKTAMSRENLSCRKLSIAIDEHEENVHPAVDWEIELIREEDSNRIAVLLLKSKDSIIEEAMTKLYLISKDMIDTTDDELEKIRDGQFPDIFKEVFEQLKGMDQYFKDLAEMLLENGEEGRKIAREVCSQKSVAEEIINDNKKPPPLKMLAKLALKEEG